MLIVKAAQFTICAGNQKFEIQNLLLLHLHYLQFLNNVWYYVKILFDHALNKNYMCIIFSLHLIIIICLLLYDLNKFSVNSRCICIYLPFIYCFR